MREDIDLGPLAPQSSSELISDSLRRVIALGGWSPGERLPSERRFAEMFQVGRDSVREAIRQLRAEGLVETRLGRQGGTFVTESPIKGVRLSAEVLSYRHEISTSFEFRRIVEPEAARLAAQRASQQEMGLIAALVEEKAWSVRSYRAIDSRFHSAIAKASGNPLLLEAIIRARATFFVWYDALYSHVDWDSLPIENRDYGLVHRPIAEAISRRDSDTAAGLMRAHLERTERAIMAMIDEFAREAEEKSTS